LLGLQACDTQIAGTNNETQTKGTFFQPGGAPDAGARVRVFQAANDSQPVRQTFVDAQGNASLTGLPHGYYSVLVQDTAGRAAFLDSLYSDGDNLPAPARHRAFHGHGDRARRKCSPWTLQPSPGST
jgi:hypothetical protein